MRRMMCATALVLALALGLCALSRRSVEGFTREARQMRTRIISAMDEGQVQLAEVRLTELAGFLKEKSALLELFCDHGDLHDMKGELIDAQASIEFGIEDDFYQAIYRFGELLDHISDVEDLRWSNIC